MQWLCTAAVALALALLLAPASYAQVCGDCNLDGQASVLDSLCAAQHHVGVKTLVGQGLVNCDVDDNGSVTVLDALLLAQCDVGLLGTPCGLGCGGLRAVPVAPTGVSSGVVLVDYTLFDDNSDPVDVSVDFSVDGFAWFAATQGAGGDPLTGRPSAPDPVGVVSVFAWDSAADGVGAGCDELVSLRVSPFDPGGPGLAGATADFPVNNSVSAFDPGPVFPGGLPLQEHVQLRLSDGRVLICGGTRDRSTATAQAFVYDPGAGTLTQVASMATPRIAHLGIALEPSDVFVAGGFSAISPLTLEDSVEYFHEVTGTWSTSPVSLQVPIAAASAAYFAARGEILILGGLQDHGAGPQLSNEAYRYEPDATTPAASVASLYNAARFARYEHTLTLLPGADGALGTADDRALVYGGSGQDPAAPPTMPLPGQIVLHTLHVLGDAEVFDPTAGQGQWHQVVDNSYYKYQVQLDPMSSLLGPRRQHAATLLEDGSVLLVGGHAAIDHPTGGPLLLPVDNRLIFAERFFPDPIVPSFSQIDPVGSTGFLRVLPTATRLDCGTVVICGGYDFAAPLQPSLAAVEVFDPAAGGASAFTLVGGLTDARWLHAATLLDDGTVLVTGGEGGDVGVAFGLASTELYRP